MVRFIHTADWQLGKPFAGVEDPAKRAILQNERIEAIKRIGKIAKDNEASFVLVAGDLFDSSTVTKATVSAACSAIGGIGLPVYVIPGNHDHGGGGGIWEQDFFRREKEQLSPNLHVLLSSEAVELENAVLFPCPLLRRHEVVDTTSWLRNYEKDLSVFGNKPLIIVAHGSVQSFGSTVDEEEEGGGVNIIDLEKLPENAFDYVALGDWHGTKKISEKIWYAGTPEPDRFPKGEDHQQGNVLLVHVSKNVNPNVDTITTKEMEWHEINFTFHDDSRVNDLAENIMELISNNTNKNLIHLHLDGSLGLEAYSKMEQLLESLQARLIRLKLDNKTVISPTSEELKSLTERSADPLIRGVARKLIDIAKIDNEEGNIAQVALREMFAACNPK